MAYDGTAWDETVPTNATLAHEIDDIARDIKIGVRSRLAIEHIWASSQAATSSAGGHVYVSLQGQTGTPTLPVVAGTTQHGLIYSDTSGVPHYRNSDGVSHIGLLETIYPVGGIYISTLSTNPATLLGFGTWVAFAEGRVLVGKEEEGTFEEGGATGGAETVTLTSAQSGLPAHVHTQTIGGNAGAPGYFQSASDTAGGGLKSTAENATANASEAHTNLQPYIVVYMWERTE